jgi:hypothetical protein
MSARAVGGHVGGRLLQTGREVDILVRSRRAEQLNQRDLRIVDGDGSEVIQATPVSADTLTDTYHLGAALGGGGHAVRGHDGRLAGRRPGTALVPFGGWMALLKALTERFGTVVPGGVLRIGTQLAPNGDIRPYLPGGQVRIGELDQQGGRGGRDIDHPNFTVTLPDDITGAMRQSGS